MYLRQQPLDEDGRGEILPPASELTLSNLWQDDLKSVIKADRFDLMDWLDVTKGNPQAVRDNRELGFQVGGDPVRDAFWAMYKSEPVIAPSPGLEVLGQIFAEAMQTPGYADLRRAAAGDLLASGLAAQFFGKTLAEIVPQEMATPMRQAEIQANRLTKLLRELSELNHILDEQGEALPEGVRVEMEQQIHELQLDAAQAEEWQQVAQNAAQAKFEANKANLVSQINQAAKQASGEVTDQLDFIRGFSEAAGGEPGRVALGTASEAMRLLQNNPHLKRLGEFLGWAKRTTRAAKRRSKKGQTQFTGYQTKELDPSHLAAFEYAAMVSQSPFVKLDFLSRVADGGVSHRHYSGEEEKNKGGMIIVRDESGSMDGAPHALAVAVEWALLEMARKDKRDFYSIPFSYDYHVWNGQEATVESVVGHLEHFYGYGTRPWPALTAALNLIDEGDMEADILFLTDEAFGAPTKEFEKALAAAKLRRPVKIMTVVIGARSNQVNWADKVICLSDLVAEKGRLSEVFELMV